MREQEMGLTLLLTNLEKNTQWFNSVSFLLFKTVNSKQTKYGKHINEWGYFRGTEPPPRFF